MSNGIDWEARYQHGDTPWEKFRIVDGLPDDIVLKNRPDRG